MRWKLACLGMMLCCTSLPAAGPRPGGKSAALTFDPIEAQNYAQAVNQTINIIVTNYVRQVSPADLTRAALVGLYEAARAPVPRSLADDVKKAEVEADRMELLARTRQRLGERAGLRGTDAALVSIRGMLKTLDPYSALVPSADLRRLRTELPDPGVGLELVDNLGAGPVRIGSVAPGSPAQRAGLRPGDQILEVDGRSTQGMPTALVLSLVNGTRVRERVRAAVPTEEVSGTVRLAVRRTGEKTPRKITIERVPYKTETVWGVTRGPGNGWDFWLDRRQKIAQVRLGSLEAQTAVTLAEVLRDLHGQGLRGLVLDLRWCPGGYLDEATSIAGLFLKENTLVATIKYRTGRRTNEEYLARGDEHFSDFPVVVLVNGETMGGAELIAASLQDHGRAVVAGQRTLGKASVQSTNTDLPIGLSLKLTTGTFLRPSGKNLHRFPDSTPRDDWGVLPDPKYEFRVSPDLGARLKEWWLWQTLRPGSSNEALPLDDPTADPQRQEAVKALVAQLEEKAKS
jgi:C-terminal peptidase prc